MTTTQTEQIELTDHLRNIAISSEESTVTSDALPNVDYNAPASAVDAIPDGGYGWVIVLALATTSFLFSGWMNSWGLVQTALLQNNQTSASTSTLTFVGSLGIALSVAFGLASNRLSRLIGARLTMLLGTSMLGLSVIFASFTIDNLGGLFMTAGVIFGLGCSILYTLANTLPVQWFSSKLGTANGLVKFGGGLGATMCALIMQILIERIGIAWTFRTFGLITLTVGTTAAILIRERVPRGNARLIDWTLFKSLPFCFLFLAGAVGTFAIFIPPYFLPLVAHSLGLSGSTGAGIVAAFNACTAVGRASSGYGCDKLGSTNMLLIAMVLNAVSMLSIWPISSTIGPLVVFAALNGLANGAFFVTLPVAVASIVGPGKAAVGMGMAATGFTGGFLLGGPIAGFLISATGAENSDSIVPYRDAIFYAGSVAMASAACVLVARLSLDRKILKRL